MKTFKCNTQAGKFELSERNGPFFPLFSGMHLFDYFFVQREIKVEFWQLKYYNEIGSEIVGHMSSISEIRVFAKEIKFGESFPYTGKIMKWYLLNYKRLRYFATSSCLVV